jgi:hypothetical protein
MIELLCDECNTHIGWVASCGVGIPMVFCDVCKEQIDKENEND